MYKYAVLICLLLAAVFPASAQNTNAKEWVKYTSDEGRYSVVLPVLPEVTSQDSNDAGGRSLKQYLASAAVGNGGLCMIGYFDHVGSSFSLDKGRDGMVKQVNGTLISEDVIALGGSPGRQLKLFASAADGTQYVIRARMYDVGTRVYILQYLSPKSIEGPAVEASAKKFLDSFAATK
jgi:hypothetical protein